MSKAHVTMLILTLAGLVLAGCHTVSGFGQDLSAAGHAISRASDEASGSSKPRHTAKTSKQARNDACAPDRRDAHGHCL